jgi:type IV secretion/conjugal transfer VirB4 family ATPase
MVPLSRILKDFREAGTLSGLVALWGFVGDSVFLTKVGALGVAYRLSPRDSECLDHDTRIATTARVAQVIRQLPESYRLYIYMLKRPTKPPSPATHANPVVRAALDERAAYIATSGLGFFTCEHYLVMLYERFARSGAPLCRPWHALSTTARQADLSAQLDQGIGALTEQASTCAALLEDVLHPTRLTKEETFRFFRRLCNYADWKSDAAPLKYDTHLDFFVADSSVECHRNFLQVDEHRAKVLTMKEPPSATYAHMLDTLHTIPQPFIACAEWQRLPAAKIRSEIRAKRRHYFNKRISLVNYLSPDTKPDHMLVDDSATNVVEELGQCLSDTEIHGRVFGSSSLTVIVYDDADDTARLDRGVSECAKVFAAHDGVLHVETFNALNAWLAVLPGNTAHNLRRLPLVDTNHADLLPIAGVDSGHPTSPHLANRECLAVFHTAQHTPYYWNLHHADVGHTLVLGATGSGKSFLLNFVITHAQKYDPITLIFDLGGGYQKLTNLLGGSSWHIGLSNQAFRINPFCLSPTAENLHFLSSFVTLLIQSAGQYHLTLTDERDLTEAIQSLYTLDPPQRRLFTLANMLPRPISNALARWVHGGPYADLFDNEEDTLTFQRLQAFDFTGLDNFPMLLEPLLFYVLHRASASIDDAPISQLKLFVLDEAWRFVRDPSVKAYVAEALKTWRKRNAALLLATQSSEDFADLDILRTVVENCATKCFLASPDMDVARAKELFHLNDAETQRILELVPRRQFLLKRPGAAKVLELHVDPRAYWLYTNTPVDNERLRHAMQTGSLDQVITQLAHP